MINHLAQKKNGGYTLVEALVYIAVFILMSSVIVALIFSVFKTNQRVAPLSALSRNAVSVLEPITREIRGASSVDIINSTWATSSGSLSLNTLDADENPRTVRFYLNAGQVKIDENGSFLGPLNSKEVTVDSLVFDLATSTGQTLVRVNLGLSAGTDSNKKSETFYVAVNSRTDN